MVSSPGARFNYGSGNAHLLSTIITRATHVSTVAYANENLFGPLGFQLSLLDWWSDPGKNVAGYGFLGWLSRAVPGAYTAIGAGGQHIFIERRLRSLSLHT